MHFPLAWKLAERGSLRHAVAAGPPATAGNEWRATLFIDRGGGICYFSISTFSAFQLMQ